MLLLAEMPIVVAVVSEIGPAPSRSWAGQWSVAKKSFSSIAHRLMMMWVTSRDVIAVWSLCWATDQLSTASHWHTCDTQWDWSRSAAWKTESAQITIDLQERLTGTQAKPSQVDAAINEIHRRVSLCRVSSRLVATTTDVKFMDERSSIRPDRLTVRDQTDSQATPISRPITSQVLQLRFSAVATVSAGCKQPTLT